MKFELLVRLLLVMFSADAPERWPQWGGENRDFRVEEVIGEQPPRLTWERALGSGHSSILSDGEHLFAHFGRAENEIVSAVDPATGNPVWENSFFVSNRRAGDEHAGPHSTPLLAGEYLITVSADATVRCWLKSNGELRWKRDLVRDFRTDLPQFGYASSPLRFNDLIFLPGLGGRAPAAIALRIADGSTSWARHAFLSSHASPILIDLESRIHVVYHGMNRLVGLAPTDGRMLWSIWLRQDAIDNVAFSPIWDKRLQQIYISHGYDRNGTRAVQIREQGERWIANEIWSNGSLRVEHGNAVISDGLLFGSAGSFLTAVDPVTGTTRFKLRGFSESTVLGVSEGVLVLSEDGQLSFIRPASRGASVVWSVDVLDATAWTAPSLLGNQLIVRDRRSLKSFRFENFPGDQHP